MFQFRKVGVFLYTRNVFSQDPVLFFGSLRMNLDPLDVYSDGQLWAALTRAHLRDFVVSLPEGLDYPVGEEGQSLRLVHTFSPVCHLLIKLIHVVSLTLCFCLFFKSLLPYLFV